MAVEAARAAQHAAEEVRETLARAVKLAGEAMDAKRGASKALNQTQRLVQQAEAASLAAATASQAAASSNNATLVARRAAQHAS